MDLVPKKRYLSKAQCKAAAARFSQEMREDREGQEKWGDMWFVSRDGRFGKKSGNLVIPGDREKGEAAIRLLYHPEEAAIIIEHLTDGSPG